MLSLCLCSSFRSFSELLLMETLCPHALIFSSFDSLAALLGNTNPPQILINRWLRSTKQLSRVQRGVNCQH